MTLLPLTPRQVWQDFTSALALRLRHDPGVYNAIQKLFYIAVLVLGACSVLSGLAIWKPVQFSRSPRCSAATTMPGSCVSGMAGIAGFIVIHLILVVLVPKTLLSMIIPAPARAHGTGARP